MIFVSLGSQKFQFNRLVKKVDELIEDGTIQEEVFAQIGYSKYKPQHFDYKEFLDGDEFINIMNKCDTVITHGGTGIIVGSVKKGKKVIAIPRLVEYGEHIDNHQLQILKQFDDMGIIEACFELKDLKRHIENLKSVKFNPYISSTEEIISSIDKFLNSGVC